VRALVALLLACNGPAETETETDPGPDAFEEVRAAARRLVDPDLAPAVSVAIWAEGGIAFAEAYGTASAEGDGAVGPETRFQNGSTTKMMTALAALRLVDEGVIALDAPLIEALPGISVPTAQAAWWGAITVSDLLTHQGGFLDAVDWTLEEPGGLLEVARTAYPNSAPLMNPPGRFWNYSNPNFSYLGAIVAHHREAPFEQVMAEEVFAPLGMDRTTFDRDAVEADGDYALGVGYSLRNGRIAPGPVRAIEHLPQPAFAAPAGSHTWSTPSDLLRFGAFLIGEGDEEVLSDALRVGMGAPVISLGIGLPEHYGHGLVVSDEGTRTAEGWIPTRFLGHDGATLAYTTMMLLLPDQGVGVAVIASGSGADLRAVALAGLRAVAELPDATAAPWAPVATERFGEHVGTYVAGSGVGRMVVSRRGEGLGVEMPDLDEAGVGYSELLEPVAADLFLTRIDGAAYDLTFFRDGEAGPSQWARNRYFVGVRQPDEVARLAPGGRAPATVRLGPVWSGVVGPAGRAPR
jgi:CubicO group peptidase (beta-lactamase class C family)